MRLIDSFMPLLGYVVALQEQVGDSIYPSFSQVQGDIQRLISLSERGSRERTVSPGEYDQARFIVCAWVDEMILGSKWSEKPLWQREPLQRLFYHTTDAGVEVFERLNQVELHQNEVREVYYLCLSLGFRGRFINPGDEFLLEQLRSSNLKILAPKAKGVPGALRGELFPQAYPSPQSDLLQETAARFAAPVLIALTGPLALFVFLYLIYHFTLGNVASKLV